MSQDRSGVYDPEDLSILGSIFDDAVTALPATMQTPANRMEIAKLILRRANLDKSELAPLIKAMIEFAPAA
jgi:hypothetical protein